MAVESSGGRTRRLDDGIFLIPGRRGGGCNVFVLKGLRRTMLIDTGLASDHDHLCAGLAEIGLGLDQIDLVALTHEHVDHVGGVVRLPAKVMVAAHGHAANKVRRNDQFSAMSGAFDDVLEPFHVDLHLDTGAILDLGGLSLQALHTPGHCSGAVCLYEPKQGALFTGDTVFADGVLGGIFASGNLSDYISSLERLRDYRLAWLYPGHGRMSSSPAMDLERAIQGSTELMSDTHHLFDSIRIDGSFQQIVRGTALYSRRAAERRNDARLDLNHEALLHEPEADHPVGLRDISSRGVRLDRAVKLAIGSRIALTLGEVGRLECRVVSHDHGCTRLEFLRSPGNRDGLLEWLGVVKRAKRQP